jgi:predicted Zn finger-like uncharacterized protein
MLIVCPTCISTYRLDPAALDRAPTLMRCAHCCETWSPFPGDDRVAVNGSSGDRGPVDCHGRSAPQLGAAAPIGSRRKLGPVRQDQSAASAQHETRALPALLALAVAVGSGMAAVGWRAPLTRSIPSAAPLYAALGLPVGADALTIQDVRSQLAREGDGKVIQVEGEIANGRTRTISVPDLRVVVRDQMKQTLYSWQAAPPKASLAPGEAITFESRFPTPTGNGQDVLVSFVRSPSP